MSQFQFLIGDWDYVGTSIQSDGSGQSEYRGFQRCEYHFGGRMILETSYRYFPTGEVNLMWTNLRTYSVDTKRWESAGQPVGGPGRFVDTSAKLVDGEMWGAGKIIVASWLPFGLPMRTRFFDSQRTATAGKRRYGSSVGERHPVFALSEASPDAARPFDVHPSTDTTGFKSSCDTDPVLECS
jgi:hypothetical protein